MTEEAQPLATNLQSTASTAPSSRPQTSGSPDPITDTSPATPPTTSTAPAELTGTENSLQAKDKEPLMDLEHFDWASLEQHYHADMRTCAATEASLSEEFNQAIRIFESWASVTTSHENERSLKRLRTRMSYVQGDEQRLQKKRQHHMRVVAAFEGALALLREP